MTAPTSPATVYHSLLRIRGEGQLLDLPPFSGAALGLVLADDGRTDPNLELHAIVGEHTNTLAALLPSGMVHVHTVDGARVLVLPLKLNLPRMALAGLQLAASLLRPRGKT